MSLVNIRKIKVLSSDFLGFVTTSNAHGSIYCSSKRHRAENRISFRYQTILFLLKARSHQFRMKLYQASIKSL